ncbi:MAG: M48 family metallopeptidase [Pseudomarimonas sp.]
MNAQIRVAELQLDVVRKRIKHLHLSVLPPSGQVRVAAPQHMSLEAIRLFAIGQLDWIRRQQRKLLAQVREAPREYLDRESHYVWGRRYLLKIIERDGTPSIDLGPRQLRLQLRPGAATAERQRLLERWYREQIRQAIPELLAKWQPRIGAEASTIFVRRMKTKWGSCNPTTRTIQLNTELAKKPPACLEYVLAHELAHLLEPTHGSRFVALLDAAMPTWRAVRDQLNALPLGGAHWPPAIVDAAGPCQVSLAT